MDQQQQEKCCQEKCCPTQCVPVKCIIKKICGPRGADGVTPTNEELTTLITTVLGGGDFKGPPGATGVCEECTGNPGPDGACCDCEEYEWSFQSPNFINNLTDWHFLSDASEDCVEVGVKREGNAQPFFMDSLGLGVIALVAHIVVDLKNLLASKPQTGSELIIRTNTNQSLPPDAFKKSDSGSSTGSDSLGSIDDPVSISPGVHEYHIPWSLITKRYLLIQLNGNNQHRIVSMKAQLCDACSTKLCIRNGSLTHTDPIKWCFEMEEGKLRLYCYCAGGKQMKQEWICSGVSGQHFMLVLDTSTSMNSYKAQVRQLATSFLDAFDTKDVHLSIMRFEGSATTGSFSDATFLTIGTGSVNNYFHMNVIAQASEARTNTTAGLVDAIWTGTNYTNWEAAFQKARDNATSQAADIIIFLTDGNPTTAVGITTDSSPDSAQLNNFAVRAAVHANAMKNSAANTRIIGILVGGSIESKWLTNLTNSASVGLQYPILSSFGHGGDPQGPNGPDYFTSPDPMQMVVTFQGLVNSVFC